METEKRVKRDPFTAFQRNYPDLAVMAVLAGGALVLALVGMALYAIG